MKINEQLKTLAKHYWNEKWYWAYTSSSVDETTYVFNTLDEARDHAIKNGEFDEICGKDYFIEHDEKLFFEARMDELKDYSPLVFCPMCEVKHENNTFCQMPAWN